MSLLLTAIWYRVVVVGKLQDMYLFTPLIWLQHSRNQTWRRVSCDDVDFDIWKHKQTTLRSLWLCGLYDWEQCIVYDVRFGISLVRFNRGCINKSFILRRLTSSKAVRSVENELRAGKRKHERSSFLFTLVWNNTFSRLISFESQLILLRLCLLTYWRIRQFLVYSPLPRKLKPRRIIAA